MQIQHANRSQLQAFLAAQAVLAGLPIILFLAFGITTLLVSLTTCLLLGILAALTVTFFIVGITLIFVVPTVFIASSSATFIFIWGLVGYTILRRLNGGQPPSKRGTQVGDKLQGLTGGRLGLWIGDGAKDRQAGITIETPRDGGEHHQGVRRDNNADHVNASNGDNGTIEWEKKWDSGVQQQPVMLETGNTYEILKVVS